MLGKVADLGIDLMRGACILPDRFGNTSRLSLRLFFLLSFLVDKSATSELTLARVEIRNEKGNFVDFVCPDRRRLTGSRET